MTITAEELSEKIKEISIAEFFEKNRHLLGYESLTKALITVVKEAVENSLTWSTPIFLEVNGKVEIRKIGEFIDEQFEKYKKFVIKERNGNLEKLKKFDPTKVLCFNPRTQKLEFKAVRTLFRHKPNSKIFRITLEGGRYIELTDYHSIFSLRGSEVKVVKTSELRLGDLIIVPRNPWNLYPIEKIDVLEELLRLPEGITRNIRIYGVRNMIRRLKAELKKVLGKEKSYRIQDFKKCDSIPLSLVRKLPPRLIKVFKKCKFGLKFSKYKIPLEIPITEELLAFLGIYVAEGCTLHNLEKVILSFGAEEKELLNYSKKIVKRVWGIDATIKKPHETAVNLIMNSKNLGFLLKHVFKVGCNAKEKRIPGFVFKLSPKLKETFILAYLSGDGHPSLKIFRVLKKRGNIHEIPAEKITLATVSRGLVVDLQYLFSSLGISYSYSFSKAEERKIKGKIARFSPSHTLYIYTNQLKSSIFKVPIQLRKVFDSKLRYSIARSNQRMIYVDTLLRALNGGLVEIDKDFEKFVKGDLGVLPIKKIEEIDYEREWVYDVSVPGNENFVAGFGPIVCHNSLDACEEAGILPEIYVSLKEIAPQRFRVIVEDNGPGIVESKVPVAFAKFLVGSKFYRLRQSRGIQGIGIHGAVLYSQLTTGKPVKVISSTGKKIHEFELMIDVTKNEPKIISHSVKENPKKWHGVRVELEIEGRYVRGSQSVIQYLKQTAIANPFAHIIFDGPDGRIEFKRAIDKIPKQPIEIKPHPYGVELGILRRMLSSTKAKTLLKFLTSEFSRIGKRSAIQICKLAKLELRRNPRELKHDEISRLHKAMQMVKLMSPPTNCLSPLGEKLIEEGLKKEINAEYFVAVTRPPTVYRGYPFQVEVGLAYGGELPEACNLLRFANKVPLIYHQAGCAITQAVKEVDWRRYGISQASGQLPSAPLTILVHFVSVWVPFTSEGKQAIANYPEIIKEIKLALQDAGRKLASYLRQKRKARERQLRRQLFERYIPVVSEALAKLTNKDKKIILNKLEGMIKKRVEVKGGKVERSEEKA